MISNTNISAREFDKLAGLVYKETGINLSGNKVDLVKARIAKRMRVTNIPTLKKYIDVIGRDADEFLSFIDAMTTNHTFFFRENKHIEYMLNNLDTGRYIKIWSAACSSGEEPYSMAVQLLEAGFRFEILATDISDTILQTAKKAIYPKQKLKAVPQKTLHKYFQQGKNKWFDHIKVRPEVRQYVSFAKFNLISDTPPDMFDVIFCRNVMIYFDGETRQTVVNRLYRALKSGGIFAIGQSESLVGVEHPFKYARPSVYSK